MLQNVGIDPKLGTVFPLELEFTDEAGETVTLGKYFKENKPVILELVYYGCPNLCTYLLNGTLEGLKGLKWSAGREFEMVAVSIDPNETPDLASTKKANYLKEYGRSGSETGWHFLTATEANVRQLADAVGFRYQYDPEIKQYAHAAGLFVLTPDGKLARTLFGIQFSPRDLRLALVEASEGKVGTIVDRLLLFCYGYDPKANKYVLFASNAMKAGGAATIFALSFLVYRLGRKRKT
ncbi:MAG: SCO family protein [Deltaproteobacteria bacterium]|nr:SCO family protein [Deltaproteobacteria bacterium]